MCVPPGATRSEPCTCATVVPAVGRFDGGGARSSARSCRPGETRTPRPLTGPRMVFKASRGRGVRGVLEKLKFYRGETLGNRGALRASVSPAG